MEGFAYVFLKVNALDADAAVFFVGAHARLALKVVGAEFRSAGLLVLGIMEERKVDVAVSAKGQVVLGYLVALGKVGIKIVLSVNSVLIVGGTLLIFGVESSYSGVLVGMPLVEQLANAAFMSISCRTAGFNSFDIAAATQVTKFTMIILMFIGASPLSTGGGIKCTTFFVLLRSVWAIFRGENEVTVFGRTIGTRARNQAFAVFTVGTLWVVTMGVLLAIVDGETNDLGRVIFETVSAFGTVGMGIGITPEWDEWGKGLLCLTMLLGRVGIMTFLLSFIRQNCP